MPKGTTIALAKRGSCLFSEKAYAAQQAGLDAIVIYDHTAGPLLTMARPDLSPTTKVMEEVDHITIPSVLITRSLGERLVAASASAGASLGVALSWRESLTHPDDRVEAGIWLTTEPSCGDACMRTSSFVQSFADTAKDLESRGMLQVSPHVMLGSCGQGVLQPGSPLTQVCPTMCVRGNRYCSVWPVSSTETSGGIEGRDVVLQDLRLVCVHRVLNNTVPDAYGGIDSSASSHGDSALNPTLWWTYASTFLRRCASGRVGAYSDSCATTIMRELGIDVAAVKRCVGDPDVDEPLPIAEQELREMAGEGYSADSRVISLPTLTVNRDQYRGALRTGAVLRALCSGYKEGTEPEACLRADVEVDECAAGKDSCWRDEANNASACHDTFRGYKCRCPWGYRGDGMSCEDIDECEEGLHNCDYKCINLPGRFRCTCPSGSRLVGGSGNGIPGVCIPDNLRGSHATTFNLLLLLCLVVVAGTLFFVYESRRRAKTRREITEILQEYMPLVGEANGEAHSGSVESDAGEPNRASPSSPSGGPGSEDYRLELGDKRGSPDGRV